MGTNRVAVSIAASTAITTTESVVATISPGTLNPLTQQVIVRGDLTIVGTTSVTGVTLRIRRGTSTSGTALATSALTISATGVRGEGIGTIDTAFDNTGYVLTAAAVGASTTVGPGAFEAQPVNDGF